MGLSIYFFVFFMTVLTLINIFFYTSGDAQGVSVTDPGFQSLGNIPFGQQDGCTDSPYRVCSSIGETNQNACNTLYPGCYWDNSTISAFFGITGCTGYPAINCTQITNQTYCRRVGCTFTSFNANVNGFDSNEGGYFSNVVQTFSFYDRVKATVLFMATFDASFTVPGIIAFVPAFILFWLPLFALLWAIYAALPLI